MFYKYNNLVVFVVLLLFCCYCFVIVLLLFCCCFVIVLLLFCYCYVVVLSVVPDSLGTAGGCQTQRSENLHLAE